MSHLATGFGTCNLLALWEKTSQNSPILYCLHLPCPTLNSFAFRHFPKTQPYYACPSENNLEWECISFWIAKQLKAAKSNTAINHSVSYPHPHFKTLNGVELEWTCFAYTEIHYCSGQHKIAFLLPLYVSCPRPGLASISSINSACLMVICW